MKKVMAAMKKSERRLLEEKLRYAVMEDIEPDPERERQVFEQISLQVAQGENTADHRKSAGGHQIGRRVLIVSAAAMLFVVLSFGFTVFMPESVSHAKVFVRSAAIWINNTFHLGYEFEEPVGNHVQFDGQDATYYTLEEAAKNIPYPLVYFDDSSLTLRSISIQRTAIVAKTVLSFENESNFCKIILTPITGDIVTSLESDFQTLVPWQHGEFAFWEANSIKYAITYYLNLEIYIEGTEISNDDFLMLCQTVKVFN